MLPSPQALQVLTWAALGWSAAAGGGGDDIWWHYEYEYFHLECFVVAGLVSLAMVFDTLHHKMHHLAAKHPDSIEEGEQQQVHHDNEVTLFESLLNQFSGELMVLGFLAFVVWIVNRAGLFSKLAKVTHSDHIRLPPDGYGYLHIVEDVHMQLFIAMLLYVFVLSLVARGTRKAEIRWEAFNHHIVSAYEVGLDPLEMEIEGVGMDNLTKATIAKYLKFRTNFLVSLEQWRGSWDLLETELEPLLLLVRSRPQIGSVGEEARASRASCEKEDDVRVLLEDWFPFDHYLSLQCRFLVTNLVQIKASTWGFFCVNVLVKAVLMRFTENAEVRHIFDALLVLIFLTFALLGVWTVSKQQEVSKSTQPNVIRQVGRQGSLMVRESVRDLCVRHSVQAANLVDVLMGVVEEDENWDTLEEEDDEDEDESSRRQSIESVDNVLASHEHTEESRQLQKQDAAHEKADDVKAALKNRTLTCLTDQQIVIKPPAVTAPCVSTEEEFRQTLMNRLQIEEPTRCMLQASPRPTPRGSALPPMPGQPNEPQDSSKKAAGLSNQDAYKVKSADVATRRQSLTLGQSKTADLSGTGNTLTRRTSFTMGMGHSRTTHGELQASQATRRASLTQSKTGDLGGRRISSSGLTDLAQRRASFTDKAKTMELGRRTSFTGNLGEPAGGRRISLTHCATTGKLRERAVSFAEPRNGDLKMERRRSSIMPTLNVAEVKEKVQDAKLIAEEKVQVALNEHKDYPWMTALTLLQIMLFSVSLSLVRFIANVHWWQDAYLRPLICTIFVLLGAPIFGILLGRWIPAFSMVLARTEFMQARNVHWVSVILEDHVTGRDEHCRLSSRRGMASKRSMKKSWQAANSSGSRTDLGSGGRKSAMSESSEKGSKRRSILDMITSITRRTSLSVLSPITQGTRKNGEAADGLRDKKLPSIVSEESLDQCDSASSMKDVYTVNQPVSADSSKSDDKELEDLPGRAAIDAD